MVHGPRLVAPFSRSEIKVSFAGLDWASSPGLDGLGTSFYHAAWSDVSEDRDHLFLAFFNSVADPGCLNREHIVLLPKASGVLGLGAY